MSIDDVVLADAVADSFGRRVLLLVDVEPSDIDGLLNRAKRLAERRITVAYDAEIAKRLFTTPPGAWFLAPKSGGWLFFFPMSEETPQFQPTGDVGEPQYVYWPDSDGVYEKVPYVRWRAQADAGNIYRPSEEGTGRPKSIWQRLKEP